MLVDCPEHLLIFRLSLSMDQRKFARKLGVSQGTIWAIENGYRKHISAKVASKMLDLMAAEKMQIPTAKILMARRSEIAINGRFDGEYAKRMADRAASMEIGVKSAVLQKPTKQEAVLLDELTRQGMAFQFHGVIEAGRKFVVDFVFPSSRSPKVVLEAKDLQLNYRKRMQAIDLAYRALKIRQTYPRIKLVAVIAGGIQNDALTILKDEYDKVLQNPSSVEVANTIRGLVGSTV